MAIKYKKDRERLKASMSAVMCDGYYWHVYLWDDQTALEANVQEAAPVYACHCAPPTTLDPETSQEIPQSKLGELHFFSGGWNMEVVVHEVLHALFHWMRVMRICLEHITNDDMEVEEDWCYRFGAMSDAVYRWLWREDDKGDVNG